MANQLPHSGSVLALDVGSKRIGTAVANVIAKLPQPGEIIINDENVFKVIASRITSEDVQLLVIGIPRNLNGEETAQSQLIRDFASELQATTDLPIAFVDESLSSVRADEVANQKAFPGASRDSLAACFILEEYFHEL